MRLIFIGLIFLLSCAKEEFKVKTCFMLISDAIPVQFWLNGEPSFNELDEAGVDKICFYQPWNCDDEIKIQIDAQLPDLYKADIINGDGSGYSQSNLSASFADWDLEESKVVMNTSNPSASERMVVPNFLTVGEEYTFAFDVDGVGTYVASGGNALNVFVAFFDADYNTLDSQTILAANGSSESNSGTFNITVPVGAVYFGIQVSAASISSGSYEVTINSLQIQIEEQSYYLSVRDENGNEILNLEFNQDNYTIYSLTLTPSDYDYLCDQLVRFFILDGESNELGYSDLQDIQENHLDTRLISYTNELDFAGIQYDVDYPPTFHIRVKSKFYTPRNQQETESEPDAEGNVIKLSSSSKKQKQLVIDPVPPYMHDKLILILQHNSIYINNRSWVQEDNYEINEINERFGLFSGSVWLTQMDDNFYTNVG